MKKLFLTLPLLLLSFFIFHLSCVKAPAPETTAEKLHLASDAQPKNIILMIGDGMGVAQVTAGKVKAGTLALEEFPVGGLMTTWADPEFVTDSAAAATALATGHKSFNGAISVDVDGNPLRTLGEEAIFKDMKCGVVSTSSVVHATPAAFLAHVDDRGKYFEIAGHMAASGADLIMGGGTAFFLPAASKEGNGREDGKDLIAQWEAEGGCFVTVLDTIPENCERMLALFYEGHMPARLDGRTPSLPEMTAVALQFLSQSDAGFFLMVEGSQIDWYGHGNDTEGQADEMMDFDEAVAVVLAFAKARGDTLVVVTADHETGGFAVMDGDLDAKTLEGAWTTEDHTATMVPLFAYGPGAEAFGGIHDNAEVGKMLFAALPE